MLQINSFIITFDSFHKIAILFKLNILLQKTLENNNNKTKLTLFKHHHYYIFP